VFRYSTFYRPRFGDQVLVFVSALIRLFHVYFFYCKIASFDNSNVCIVPRSILSFSYAFVFSRLRFAFQLIVFSEYA